jgi:UDP-N-acetylglucosamine 2-epimerase (non-hydrolysing)
MLKKTIISVVGIRPDFIRMSRVFEKLDQNFNHILIHTGQHFDEKLSGVFFEELSIRKPDYNLAVGGLGKEHFYQVSEISIKLIELIREKGLNPDLIVFLGDSNSVACSVALKKEGFKIGHIEAGMRSGDRSMLEETNRIVCDHCSDFLFPYHKNYQKKLKKEGIYGNHKVKVVGNTIVEVCSDILNKLKDKEKSMDQILLDIHRPENFQKENRLSWIINYAQECGKKYGVPVKMLKFKRTCDFINKYSILLGEIEEVELMGYPEYLRNVYHSKFIISDSGTAQEEPAFFGTKVIVPRDFTERPESVEANCSFMLNIGNFQESFDWIDSGSKIDSSWMGNGTTSEQIIKFLKKYL